MAKVFVVIETYFNGEDSSQRVSKVFGNEVKANTYADEKNAARQSSNGSTYDVEEHDVED